MIKTLLLIRFLSLSRASECFQSTNLMITLFSCPLLLLESGVCDSPQYPSDLSPLQNLQILITVFSRILPEMLFGMPDMSMLFLQQYCSTFTWFFVVLVLQFAVNIFYYCYITLEFLVLRHNLVHPFCKSFNFFCRVLCTPISMTAFPLRSRIFWTKSDFFNGFNADSDKFKIFVLLSHILNNLLKHLDTEMKILRFSR